MDRLVIEGGCPLRGEVRASGAKNAALPMMVAALLCDGPLRLGRVPDVADVRTLTMLLSALGVSTANEAGQLLLEADADGPTEAPYDAVRRMRASVCVLGPLLARRGEARVALPGGCVIGSRPIDLHLKGLSALGADLRLEHGAVVGTVPSRGLSGARVALQGDTGPTVLGTANVMMAAALARGETVIEGAAQEPELVALAGLLNRCGAQIEGAGSSLVRIEGVERLSGATASVPPDRIEAGTLLLAGAASQGTVTVTDCEPADLVALVARLRESGVPLEVGEASVAIAPPTAPLRAVSLETGPFPDFPTDLQAQWMAYSLTCHGRAEITERIYPDRFLHVAELNRLGAGIVRRGASATVPGPAELSGAPLMASDLRASAALVIAGLVAEGESAIRRIYHLDRGYERLEEKLTRLGARIVREPDPSSP